VLKPSLKTTLMLIMKRIIKKYILRRQEIIRIIYKETPDEQRTISQYTTPFILKYLQPATPEISSEKELSILHNYNFDAYIVGSDQVWRAAYTGDALRNYFLDFVKSKDTKKISYAASFGLKTWQCSRKLTHEIAFLLKRFDAVSVREDSGVELCKLYLNIEADHVLDPTFLLQPEDYMQLVSNESTPQSPGNLLVYIIENSEHKKTSLDRISNYFRYTPFSVHKKTSEIDGPLEDRVFPPVTCWLRGFMDAKYVFTDSYHGCVFSILFNKPFIVFGNQDRGMARFDSLLRMYGLEDRLISCAEELTDKRLLAEIDWKHVNFIMKEKRKHSEAFLKNSLL
jgi:hypothetical protein